MRIIYFFDYKLSGLRTMLPGSAADHRAPHSKALEQMQEWQDVLMRHQDIYEELLASPEWASAAERSTLAPSQHPLSVLDLTRDLAGWSPPHPGILQGVQS